MSVQEKINAFYRAIADDPRIGSTHISIYMALLQRWGTSQDEPLQLSRHEIMKAAKISARQTFNKYMHELNRYGYIRYVPSTGPFQPGIIYMIKV